MTTTQAASIYLALNPDGEHAQACVALLAFNRSEKRDNDGKWTAGETVRVDGSSPDGKFSGFANVTVIDPHSNRDAVTHTAKDGRQYEGAHSHIPKMKVSLGRSNRKTPLPPLEFEAYHHQATKMGAGRYVNTPHKTIEEIAQIAKDRVGKGESASSVANDLIEGYNFEHGSANARMIRDATTHRA